MKSSLNATIDLIKRYRWNSIFFLYLKKFTVIILIPIIVLTGVIYYLYLDNTTKSVHYTIDQTFDHYKTAVNNTFYQIEDLNNTIMLDSNVKWFLSANVMNFSDAYLRSSVKNTNTMISGYLNTLKYINSIHIYSASNDYVISTKNSNFVENFYKKDLISRLTAEKKPFFIAPDIENDGRLLHICMGTYKYNKLYSIVIVTVNWNEMINVSESEMVGAIVLSQGGQVIYSTKDGQSSGSINELYPYANTPSSSTKNEFFNIFRPIALTSALDSYNLDLLIDFSLRPYSVNLSKMSIALIICILLALFIPVIISAYLSIQYYKSISNIVAQLHDNLPSQPNTKDTADEIMDISHGIMNILEKTKDVENSLTEKILLLKSMQTRALQSQINPHFLFNTLNSINVFMLDRLKTNSEPVIMISLLSEMLSEVLDVKEYITTIKKEISYAEKYLQIESIRYMNNFDVSWQIDNSILECKTIKMVLQPIIENALVHGIRPLPQGKKGVIRISVYAAENNIEISVCDNGVGFTPKRLKEVRDQLSIDDIPDSKHIGLKNVDIRLKTIYGSRYGCEIQTSHEETCVRIVIPQEV